jgi:hypothetical protein
MRTYLDAHLAKADEFEPGHATDTLEEDPEPDESFDNPPVAWHDKTAASEPDMLAHQIASEVAKRLSEGQPPQGRDSIYNLVREVGIDILDKERTATRIAAVDGAPSDPAAAIAHFESQGALPPGTPGYWKVWGAKASHVRTGDIILSKSGDATHTDYVSGTFESKSAPMRRGFLDADGNQFTVGALAPIIVMRWSDHNLLAGDL